jgi:hypothetical protein
MTEKTLLKKEPRSYESEALSVLAFEFPTSNLAESERKIKRRLRDKKLGTYDQGRIDALRAFKDDVQQELGKDSRSKYYTHSHGQYADLQDWDIEQLTRYMMERHPGVSETVIGGFLPYAIYLYYLR